MAAATSPSHAQLAHAFAQRLQTVLAPLRRERAPLSPSPTFPVATRFPSPVLSQPAPSPHDVSSSTAAHFFEGQDRARAAADVADVAAGLPLSGLVGAWAFSRAYEELRCGSAAAAAPPMLCGAHEARLTLRRDGTFRARCRYTALGPDAARRSLNLDAHGRWAYLLGDQRLVLAPSDPSFRISVVGLGLDRDADRLVLTVSKGGVPWEEAAIGSGAGGGAGALGWERRWATLEHSLERADHKGDDVDGEGDDAGGVEERDEGDENERDGVPDDKAPRC